MKRGTVLVKAQWPQKNEAATEGITQKISQRLFLKNLLRPSRLRQTLLVAFLT
jgi:hypothetical protein